MEAVLFRLMAKAAEQKVAAARREGTTFQPEQIAQDVIAEFREFLQFERHAEALQARVYEHLKKLAGRRDPSPPSD